MYSTFIFLIKRNQYFSYFGAGRRSRETKLHHYVSMIIIMNKKDNLFMTFLLHANWSFKDVEFKYMIASSNKQQNLSHFHNILRHN